MKNERTPAARSVSAPAPHRLTPAAREAVFLLIRISNEREAKRLEQEAEQKGHDEHGAHDPPSGATPTDNSDSDNKGDATV